MFLDELEILDYNVHFGTVGVYGKLGFGDLLTSVNKTFYDRAISLHAPSNAIFKTDGRYNSFSAAVALNDTAGEKASANFMVYADGKLVACAPNIKKTNSPQYITANVQEAKTITLEVETTNGADCHTVWLNPEVDTEQISKVYDPLHNTEAILPKEILTTDKCVFTTTNSQYCAYTLNMLRSFLKFNTIDDTYKIVVLGYDLSDTNIASLEKLGATIVKCNCDPNTNNLTKKILIYKIANIIRANKYMFLDADTLICNKITDLFDMLDYLSPYSFLGVKFNSTDEQFNIQNAIVSNFHGSDLDSSFLSLTETEKHYTSTINSGMFVATDKALLAIEQTIKSFMPTIRKWESQYHLCNYREEAILLFSLARLQSAILLKPTYNLQMHDDLICKDIVINENNISYKNQPAFILHFVGNTKESDRYKEINDIINPEDKTIEEPIVEPVVEPEVSKEPEVIESDEIETIMEDIISATEVVEE